MRAELKEPGAGAAFDSLRLECGDRIGRGEEEAAEQILDDAFIERDDHPDPAGGVLETALATVGDAPLPRLRSGGFLSYDLSTRAEQRLMVARPAAPAQTAISTQVTQLDRWTYAWLAE